MLKACLLQIQCLVLLTFTQGLVYAIDAQKFCGPLMKTYIVEDLSRTRTGSGIRCVSPDMSAFYGEGFWGKSESGVYKQMGVLSKNELGFVASLKLIDLGLRRTDSENCETLEIGQAGIRRFEVKAFARPDLYGNFQKGFVVSGLNERWIEIEDLSTLEAPPFEGLKDANDCMAFTGVQYAQSAKSDKNYLEFRCVLPSAVDPSSAEPLMWVSKNLDGSFGLGWSEGDGEGENRYNYHSMNCESKDCIEATDLRFAFESKRSVRLMGQLEETWTFDDPTLSVEPPACHLSK